MFWDYLINSKFHGISWNYSYHRNWRTTFYVIPWISMELLVSAKLAHTKFHGTPWNSMELLVSSKLAHSKFHGIPWNYSCRRNGRIPSLCNSVEFPGTARVSELGALQFPWNSMEFHGTALVIEIGGHQVSWNSMEFRGTASVIDIGVLQVQWNSMESVYVHETTRVNEVGAI